MSKRIDITGQRFGRLVAIKWLGYNSGHSKWECQCDCGTLTQANYRAMLTGNTNSCGCLHKELLSKALSKRRREIFKFNDVKLGKKYTYYTRNALRRGHNWELTPTEFEELVTSRCHYCGSNTNVGVDRVNSSESYNSFNVVPCCTSCNQAKNDKTVEQFKEWLRLAYQHLETNDWKISYAAMVL